MDAGDLAVFAAVARTGCISKAAETLNTVQSNVTQRIQLLENEVGAPLFYRHARGVTLTTAGSQLLLYAERIVRLVGEAKQAASNGPVPHGRIIIGAMETATALRLPPILSAYAQRYPDVDIEISTGPSAALIEGVLARRLEAAFVAGPVNHPELITIPMVAEELVVITAPWIRDLRMLSGIGRDGQLKIVVFRSGCSYRARLESILAKHGIVAVRRLELGSVDGILGCVAAGIGVTLLPRVVAAEAQKEGRVAIHALTPEESRVETVLVRCRDGFLSTALAKFIEITSDYLGAVDHAPSLRAQGSNGNGNGRARHHGVAPSLAVGTIT